MNSLARHRTPALDLIALVLSAVVLGHSDEATALPADLDLSFNGTGQALAAAGTTTSPVLDATLPHGATPTGYSTVTQHDGKVLVVGSCPSRFCIARFTAAGVADTSFRGAGVFSMPQTVSPSTGLWARTPSSILLQSDGKIIVSGTCEGSSGERRFCASRFLANGNDDTSFGVAGTLTHASVSGQGNQFAFAAALQNDGRLLIGGGCEVSVGGPTTFCIARFLTNGAPDGSFGSATPSAHVQISIQPVVAFVSAIRAIVVNPNGAITVAGYCASGTSDLALVCMARLNSSGALDATFNPSGAQQTPGIRVTEQLAETHKGMAIVSLPDGAVLVASICEFGLKPVGCIGRYLVDANPDLTYGVDFGITDTNTASFNSSPLANVVDAVSLSVQPDGKAIISGACVSSPSITAPCQRRYHSDGSIDASFKGTPVIVINPPPRRDVTRALALQPDGKFIAAGYCGVSAPLQLCAFRFQGGPTEYANCSADIDGDGAVTTHTDSVLLARAALGFSGAALTQGLAFSSLATRNTHALVRDYLFNHCGMRIGP